MPLPVINNTNTIATVFYENVFDYDYNYWKDSNVLIYRKQLHLKVRKIRELWLMNVQSLTIQVRLGPSVYTCVKSCVMVKINIHVHGTQLVHKNKLHLVHKKVTMQVHSWFTSWCLNECYCKFNCGSIFIDHIHPFKQL